MLFLRKRLVDDTAGGRMNTRVSDDAEPVPELRVEIVAAMNDHHSGRSASNKANQKCGNFQRTLWPFLLLAGNPDRLENSAELVQAKTCYQA